MSNKDFDHKIKAKLDDLSHPKSATDWDDFSRLLSREEGFEDVPFDDMVKGKLKNSRKSFNSLHWIILKNRLEKEARLRKEVYTRKIMEGILVLLLTFTFFNLDHFLGFSPNTPESPETFATKISLQYPEFAGIITPEDLAKSGSKTNTAVAAAKKTTQIIPEKSSGRFQNAGEEKDALKVKNIPVQIIKLDRLPRIQKRSSKPVVHAEQSFEDVPESQDGHPVVDDVYALSSIREFKYDMKEAYPMFYVAMDGIPESEKNYYISFHTASIANNIQSPGDASFGIDPYQIMDLGVNFGFDISAKYKHLEFGTGLTYQKLGYSPIKLIEITERPNGPATQKSLDYISFDVFQVPVFFRYHLQSENSLHLWASGGVGMNGIAFTNYSFSEFETERAPEPFGPDGQSFNERNSTERSLLNEKNFHPGFLQEGSLFDNFYLTAFVSAGLEKSITESISLNSSLGFHKMISSSGLGPNGDFVDAICFGIGLKYKI